MSNAPTPLISIVGRYLPAAEKIFLAGLAVGVVLLFMSVDTTVLMISLNGLAVVYFLFAYKPLEIQREEGALFGFSELLAYMIVPKVMWIASAVSLIGIMFSLLKLEGSSNMLLIGLISLGIGTLLLVIFKAIGVKQLEVLQPMLYRTMPLLFFDLYTLLR
ncbi:MAG: hypothetical protein RIB47_15775 [Cyclobacteriaceae bacterium]